MIGSLVISLSTDVVIFVLGVIKLTKIQGHRINTFCIAYDLKLIIKIEIISIESYGALYVTFKVSFCSV